MTYKPDKADIVKQREKNLETDLNSPRSNQLPFIIGVVFDVFFIYRFGSAVHSGRFYHTSLNI